jgi:hypothetical protein
VAIDDAVDAGHGARVTPARGAHAGMTPLDARHARNGRLQLAFRLSWIALALTLAAAGPGLFVPAVYRAETAWVVPQNRGQDLVTLVGLALMAVSLRARGRAWGYVLAGFMRVKAATMGLALLAMTGFAWRAGLAVEVALSAAWVALAASGLAMSWAYFRRCRSGGA